MEARNWLEIERKTWVIIDSTACLPGGALIRVNSWKVLESTSRLYQLHCNGIKTTSFWAKMWSIQWNPANRTPKGHVIVSVFYRGSTVVRKLQIIAQNGILSCK